MTPSTSGFVNFKAIAAEIEAVMGVDGWCSLDKATTMAAIIVALRPQVVVEPGVWLGGSAIPMAIALRQVGTGRLIAVDAWSVQASIAGQETVHSTWWERIGVEGHDRAFRTFWRRLLNSGIASDRFLVLRQRTDEAVVPPMIDLLHHDANH